MKKKMSRYHEDKRTIAGARKAIRRMDRARHFPRNTDSCSRHVAIMARALAAGRTYHMLDEEPRHCATSLAVTVGLLWRARTKIEALERRLARFTAKRPAGASRVGPEADHT